MQLNALIRNESLKRNVKPHILLRWYLFERFLERLSKSCFRRHFIIKGGYLVARMVGVGIRSTADLDITATSLDLSEAAVQTAMGQILAVALDDGVEMSVTRIEAIREASNYPGFRVHVATVFGTINQTLRLDITTGDVITPTAIESQIDLMFEDRSINVLTYNLETLISEKLETILTKGILSTRMRDYYDVYILYELFCEKINEPVLKRAFQATCVRRNSREFLAAGKRAERLVLIQESVALQGLWEQFILKNPYVAQLSWIDVILSLVTICNDLT